MGVLSEVGVGDHLERQNGQFPMPPSFSMHELRGNKSRNKPALSLLPTGEPGSPIGCPGKFVGITVPCSRIGE